MAKDDDIDDAPLNLLSLTDEELAALKESEDEDATAAAAAAKAAKEIDEGPSEDDGTADEGTDDNGAEETAAAADDDLGAAPTVVAFTAEQKSRLDAIDGEREALIAKFDDGEITQAEFKEDLGKLTKEEAILVATKDRAEQTERDAIAYEEKLWHRDLGAFFGDHPEVLKLKDGNDAQKAAWAALDKVTRQITGSEMGNGLTNRQIMDRALALTKLDHPGVIKTPRKAKADVDPATPKEKAKKDDRRSGSLRPSLPPRLANMPAADEMAVDDSRFGRLNHLAATDGEAFEAALARMTPAQRRQYEESY